MTGLPSAKAKLAISTADKRLGGAKPKQATQLMLRFEDTGKGGEGEGGGGASARCGDDMSVSGMTVSGMTKLKLLSALPTSLPKSPELDNNKGTNNEKANQEAADKAAELANR